MFPEPSSWCGWLPGGLGTTSPAQRTADFQSLSRCLSWQPQIQTSPGPVSRLVTSGSCRWLLATGKQTKQEQFLQLTKIISYLMLPAGPHLGFRCSFLHVPAPLELHSRGTNSSGQPGHDSLRRGAAAGQWGTALMSHLWLHPGGLSSALPRMALAGHIFTDQG